MFVSLFTNALLCFSLICLIVSVRLDADEKLKLFHYLAYFCYYS